MPYASSVEEDDAHNINKSVTEPMHSFIQQSHTASPLKYFFRMPQYPVLCCIDGQVFSATSEHQFVQQLSQYTLHQDAQYDVIDVTGEHWTLHPDMMLLSPLNLRLRQRWTKLQLIRLVNNRSNTSHPDEPPYSERSLSAKRFDRIFHDLVAITNADGEPGCPGCPSRMGSGHDKSLIW